MLCFVQFAHFEDRDQSLNMLILMLLYCSTFLTFSCVVCWVCFRTPVKRYWPTEYNNNNVITSTGYAGYGEKCRYISTGRWEIPHVLFVSMTYPSYCDFTASTNRLHISILHQNLALRVKKWAFKNLKAVCSKIVSTFDVSSMVFRKMRIL